MYPSIVVIDCVTILNIKTRLMFVYVCKYIRIYIMARLSSDLRRKCRLIREL